MTEFVASEAEKMSVEDVFEGAFATERKRRVVDALRREESTTIADIAMQIAAWENDIPVQAVDRTKRQRVYVPLYQNQLKALEDAGVVEWNKDRGTVEQGPAFENAVEVIESIRELCSSDSVAVENA